MKGFEMWQNAFAASMSQHRFFSLISDVYGDRLLSMSLKMPKGLPDDWQDMFTKLYDQGEHYIGQQEAIQHAKESRDKVIAPGKWTQTDAELLAGVDRLGEMTDERLKE